MKIKDLILNLSEIKLDTNYEEVSTYIYILQDMVSDLNVKNKELKEEIETLKESKGTK